MRSHRLCVAVVAAALGLAPTGAAAHTLALGSPVDSLDIDWQPLAAHHADRFFRTLPGWTETHIHRRLQDCTSYQTDIKEAKDTLTKFTTKVTTFDPKVSISAADSLTQALDFGEKFGSIKFESMMHGLQGFMAVGAGVLTGFQLNSIFSDLSDFKKQVKEVFAALTAIQLRVEKLPDVIEYELNRAEYNRLVNDAQAQITMITNQIEFPDALQATCLAFDTGKVSEVADAVNNFASICKPPNADKDNVSPANLRKCFLGIGTSLGGVLAQLVSSMAVCISVRSPYATEESLGQLRTAKLRGIQFFASVGSAIRNLEGATGGGTSSGSGSSSGTDPLDDALEEYNNSTSTIAAEAPSSDPRVDSYVDKLVEGMNSYNFAGKDYAARVANYTAQEAWKAVTASNPVAREMGTAMALGIGFKYNQKMDRLAKLDDKIYSTFKEKEDLVVAADAKVWDYHGQIMTKVGNLATTFTTQFNQRMDKMNGIQSKVNTIQSNVDSGFASLKSQLSNMGAQWGNQITDIDNEIVKQGGETTSYLSNAIAASTEQIGNRIAGIQTEVVQDHKQVMSALSSSQSRVLQEYGATRDTLYSASNALSDTISTGMSTLDAAVRQSFDAVTDAVARRMEDAHAHLSDMVSGVSRALAFVDNRLMVFDSQVQDMSQQLDAVTQFLHDVHTTFESIAAALGDLPSAIRTEIFKDRYDHLEDQYMKIRDGYADFINANLTASVMVGSCEAHQPYDLFQSFLELVDIPDGDIPRQLERFGNKVQVYERFGLIALGILRELSYLDGVCAKLELGATFKELQAKAQEQDDMIVAASATLVRHVEEAIPAYLLNVRAAELVAGYSTRDWTTQGAKLAEQLRQDLQSSVGSFARVSVIHAGLSGVLDVKHLDTDVDYANAKTARRRGIQVSKNKKLAVVWGNSKQLAAALPLDATTLLRQGIFRGNVTVSPPSSKCFLALAPGFYPVCDLATCACAHFEDFASDADPTAGRAVTRFATNDYASDFVVDAVHDASVDYVLLAAAVSAKQLPVLQAFGALRASTLVGKTMQQQVRPVWESYTDVGKFEAVASDVSGVRLAKNELVLDIEMRTTGQAIRHVFPLFCNSEMQQATVGTWLTVQYACKEVMRTRVLADANASAVALQADYPVATTGVPTNRLDLAVCAAGSDASKKCIVTGSMDLAASAHGSALAVGDSVQDVTMFKDAGLKGEFVVCRQCSPADLATVKNMQSVLLGVPDIPVTFLNVVCGSVPGHANMLYCREATA